MRPDLIIVDEIHDEITLKIDQSRAQAPRMEDSEAPFSMRWKDAEKRGYTVHRGKRRWHLKYQHVSIRVEPMRRMTLDKVKRKALPYAIAHEIMLRIRDGEQRPQISLDDIRNITK